MDTIKDLSLRLHSLCVFRNLLNDSVISSLLSCLDSLESENTAEKVDKYTNFVYSLYSAETDNLTRYIQKIVNESENLYVRTLCIKGKECGKISDSLKKDLETLEKVSKLSPDDFKKHIDCPSALADWVTDDVDLAEDYYKRIENIEKYGYGIYAKHRMFYIGDDNSVVPVRNPDSVSLDDLIDYEREKEVIINNTKALLDGKPAANILLTGDAGTGKSSTVKAVVNELYKDGLRIIEVRKEQLTAIPEILDELSFNPLKFILFIDDLSFGKNDDNFSALKAILEGSVSSKSQNIVIYATSNRRHLVKETFRERDGDDIHFNDTTQEIMSLSERFGIHLSFQRPDKNTYLEIVTNLAEKNGLEYDKQKLELEAEKFVLGRSSRSARAAKQFIDEVISGNKTIK